MILLTLRGERSTASAIVSWVMPSTKHAKSISLSLLEWTYSLIM